MKNILFVILTLFAIGRAAIFTADSAGYVSCSTIVANAGYGDTVIIPPDTATWTKGISFIKDIHIIGSGINSTKLILNFTNNNAEEAFFKFTPDITSRNNLDSLDDTTHTFDVTGIYFCGNSRMTNKFSVWIANTNLPVIKRVRVYENKFTDIHRACQIVGYINGVFYRNTCINTNGAYPQGAGLGEFTNNVRLVGTSNAWYIEDNTFSFSTNGIISGAANSGGSHVIRYNTVTGSSTETYVETHSNQSSFIKGGFFTEIYGNRFSSTANQGFDMRGGQALIFCNLDNDDTHIIREEYQDTISGDLPPNQCPLSGPQIPDDSCECWKIHNSYFFNNRNVTTNTIQNFSISYDRYNNVNTNDPLELVENREFFNYNSSFDGTSGVGYGAIGVRPSTCTKGVGYWATTQSATNLTGMVGASPSTRINGVLYKATSTNMWDTAYIPYIYPHPLRNQNNTQCIITIVRP